MGIGVQSPPGPPAPLVVEYSNFRYGLMLGDRAQDLPEGYYSFALDVETSRRDGAKRTAGITLVEDTGHQLDNWAVQMSLDFQSSLVAFDAPYIGVKSGDYFQWKDCGLDANKGRWVSSNYGDVLLFSNGVKSYSRDGASQSVQEVAGMPGGATILTAFGRVFVGGTAGTDGQYNVLGIMWNGVTGDFSDWTGLGAGGELLLIDAAQSDRIVAARIVSYDLIAILCRRSIWIGARSGATDRPADFQFRLTGIGCVAEPTAQTTEAGVTFLSDEGVRHFDGQTAQIISGPVNEDILPIDFENIDKYRSTWDSTRRRYILCTPDATYIHQFPTPEYPQGAWFKKSIRLTNVITFAKQQDDPSWDDLGTLSWDNLTMTWIDLSTPESTASPQLLFANGSLYGVEDDSNETYFGTLMSPVFEPRPVQRQFTDSPDRIVQTSQLLIDYAGHGVVQFLGRTAIGTYEKMAEVTLEPGSVGGASTARSARVNLIKSMRAVGIAVRLVTGPLEILRIQQLIQDNGPAIQDMFTEDHQLLSEAATTTTLAEADSVLLWQYHL